MAEPLATAPGRLPAPPGGATAAGPVEADAPRRSGAFVTAADRRRYAVVVAVLAAVAVLSTAGILLWGNEAEPGSRAFWMIARMRVESLGVIGIVALCHSFATVSFHT
ncbi:enterochelin ABC transporter permease, partial [Rhizobium leguminosarum]|nr:enterochelin ABC transporter permease [Rhizobium leguminosarum]